MHEDPGGAAVLGQLHEQVRTSRAIHTPGLLQVRGLHVLCMYKTTGYFLSACLNQRGTICPHVQNKAVLFVRPVIPLTK